MKRRDLLRHIGLWALAAPILSATSRTARAAGSVRRLVVIFTPNGPQHVDGPSEGTEHDFALHPWWAPLEPYRDRGFFFRRVHQAGVRFGENSEYGHRSGTVGALTATTTGPTGTTATGPSIDQFIGQQLEQSGVITPKRSMLFSLQDKAAAFYEAAGQPAVPIVDPYEALADIAPAFGGDNAEIIAALTRKEFALGRIGADCNRLRGELDGTGREMLDFHCDNVASLRAGVQASLEGGAGCEAPSDDPIGAPSETSWLGREQRDVTMDAFTRLIPLAFACDITRVIGLSIGSGASRFSLPEAYGVPSSDPVDSGDSGPQMHAWTHRSANDPGTLDALQTFHHWFCTKVVGVLDALASSLDVDGRPLLDSTVVLWTSEFGSGGPHSNDNVPVMLFGDSDGQWVSGRHFEIEGNREERSLPLHALFVSLARHMGLDSVDTFGNAGAGPLDWLEG